MTGTDLIERLVAVHLAADDGLRVAYVDPDVGEVSYQRLYEAARRYAGRLAEAGIASGTRGLVIADDSVATVVAILGSWWHGCTPVPVSPLLSKDDLEYVAEQCTPRFVHWDEQGRRAERWAAWIRPEIALDTGSVLAAFDEEVTGIPVEVNPPDAAVERPALWPDGSEALVQFTSGSTGRPKGVRHTAQAIVGMLDGFGGLLGLRPDDRVLSSARMTFGYGFGSSVLCSLSAGATVILIRGAIDVHSVVAAAQLHGPTVFCSVPRMYAALMDHQKQRPTSAFSSVRLCLSAGENCPRELADRIRRVFSADLVNCLGATEALHVVLSTHTERDALGSLGFAVPGTIATVRDGEGRTAVDGGPGRLHVAGPTVSLGYIGQSDARVFADGGLYTGDIACRRDDGSFDYVCRNDDLLMLGGHKVAPGEIESAVLSAEGVRQCAVIGAFDDHGLMVAIAYVVPEADMDADTVRRTISAAIRGKLPPYKRPSTIELIPELPVTVTGKIAAYQLRSNHGSSR